MSADPYYLWSHPSHTPRIARRSEASFAAGDPLWVAEYPVEVWAAPGGQEPVASIRNGVLMAIAQGGRLLMHDGTPVPDGPLYAGPIAGVKAEWQPIETAPMHKEVLLYREDAGVFTGIFTAPMEFVSEREYAQMSEEELENEDWFGGDYTGSWRLDGDEKPTHWMPLPPAPGAQQEKSDG